MLQIIQKKANDFKTFREQLNPSSDNTVPIYEICIFIGYIPQSIKNGIDTDTLDNNDIIEEKKNNDLFWLLGNNLQNNNYTIFNTYDDFLILFFLHKFPQYLNRYNLPCSNEDENERNLNSFCSEYHTNYNTMYDLLREHNIFKSPLSNLTHRLVTDKQQQQSVYDLNRNIQQMVLQNQQNNTVFQNLNKLF